VALLGLALGALSLPVFFAALLVARRGTFATRPLVRLARFAS
jgi:hypothetical protein